MPIPEEKLIDFLKDRQLFKNWEEEDILKIASRLEEIRLPRGEILFSAGDKPTHFYIIYRGSVRAWQGEQEDKQVEIAILEAGDKIGIESMLYRQTRRVNATALENTVLLALDQEDFEWMLSSYPDTKDYLALLAESRDQARRREFEWLHKREAIHIITQRHPLKLITDLVLPLVIMLVSIAGLYYFGLRNAEILFPTVPTIISGFFLVVSFLRALWLYLDWRNDYFIITSQRVVWLEQILLQGTSRREAPLAAIQSVDMQTTQLGRIFGYGNILVRTFTGTGSMKLTNVNQPREFMGEIQELLLRVRQKSQVTYEEKLRYSVRKSLGMEAEEVEDPVFYAEEAIEVPVSGLALLRTRQVSPDGQTITYHRHWWVLMIKTILPLIGLTVWTALFVANLFNNIAIPVIQNLQPLSYAILWLFGAGVLGSIVAYHYVDWKNDIYKINPDDMIIDAEKKPFGEEISRSAPIRNIISLEHNRVGLLRLILNFGNVEVVVADTTLTFYDVHDPAQVQQDIYYRQEQIKMKSEEQEREEDFNQIARWLRAYHEVTEEERLKEQRRLAGEDDLENELD